MSFESHVTGLSSVMFQDFDDNAHQNIDKPYDGIRKIWSYGAEFLSMDVARTILDIEKGASIAEVAHAITPLLHNTQSTSCNGAQ